MRWNLSEGPPIPEPYPEIKEGVLWIALIVPPSLTSLTNILIEFGSRMGIAVGITLAALSLVLFYAIIGFSILFNKAVGKRYRGRSLLYLNLAYFIGQFIVCPTLLIGICVLFL